MRLSPRVIALALATSGAVAVPLIGSWEGLRNDPYDDVIGVKSVCYGETRVEMRRYTDSECQQMLARAVEGFAREVLSCTPGLAYHPYQLAAATSLAYNIGSQAYCRSTVAKRFNGGDFAGACDGFRAWRYAGGREVQGLVNRRRDERELCMTGLEAAA